MKTGQPNKIRAAPPTGRSAAETLAALDRVSDWTEEPAKTAAAAISAPAQVIAPSETQKPTAARFPWEEPTQGVKLVNFKIPMALYLKLKYLGDTTYGASMTSILIEALEAKTAELLRDRQP